ncbi:MAG: Asp-tRNA(Asn)/Glu-tRNA(Gln) amidotransferase subunit GatC [Saprospiraceae bacterium]|nr:Asp-tRNA(Asn)/Glu-tRNA(Gln) amidotransferase subunit GatC [Saprospiraceae bacterium]
MQIDDQLIKNLESLSKLELEQTERENLKSELSKMLDMFGKIAEVNTEGVLPLTHMTDSYNIMRNDEPQQELGTEGALKNAPLRIDNFFGVPKVID